MKRNIKVYIAFGVIVTAIGFLLFFGFNNESMVYYSTVRELQARGENAVGHAFRVSGTVVDGSLIKASDRIESRFQIEEEGLQLPIVYRGILPDTFKEGISVLVEGKMQGDGSFYASNVLTKCASKYDPAMETTSSQTAVPMKEKS